MQYLVSVIDDESESGTPNEMTAVDVFNERLQTEGHWVFAAGVGGPDTATVIDGRGEAARQAAGARQLLDAAGLRAGALRGRHGDQAEVRGYPQEV